MNKSQLTLYESLLSGIIGGTSETFIQMPLLTYKFCRQNNTKFPTTFKGWYRGALIQSYNIAPITAIQMMTNNMLTKFIVRDNIVTYKQKIGIASLAGGLSAFLYTPIDFITIHQQKNKQNVHKTANKIWNKYGYKPFYKGLFPCIIRESLYTGGYLGLAPIVSKHLQEKLEINMIQSIIYGSLLTGTMVSLITHPFDTTKTVLQTDLTKNQNTFSKMNSLIKNHGISYLYKGCIPRVLRTCGAFMICISVENFVVKITK
jgi:hypothetical protein